MSSDEKKVKKVAVKKVSVPPQASREPSEYELLRDEKVARNKARLEMLGLLNMPTEAKKKVTRKRKSPTVNLPQRQLPDRESKK